MANFNVFISIENKFWLHCLQSNSWNLTTFSISPLAVLLKLVQNALPIARKIEYIFSLCFMERENQEALNHFFFFFACSIAKAKWFACSIKAWFFATSIYNFLAITSGEGHVESMVFPRTLWPEKRKIIYNN